MRCRRPSQTYCIVVRSQNCRTELQCVPGKEMPGTDEKSWSGSPHVIRTGSSTDLWQYKTPVSIICVYKCVFKTASTSISAPILNNLFIIYFNDIFMNKHSGLQCTHVSRFLHGHDVTAIGNAIWWYERFAGRSYIIANTRIIWVVHGIKCDKSGYGNLR